MVHRDGPSRAAGWRCWTEPCSIPETPLLRPDDLGVLRGEGVFETTLVVDGEPRDLDDHLVRLAVSAEMTGLVVPAPDAVAPGRARAGAGLDR